MNETHAKKNTDRELWRERDGDYYSDRIHVTEGGGIGINCGGSVIVMPIRKWHELAKTAPHPSIDEIEAIKADLFAARSALAEKEREVIEQCAKLCEAEAQTCMSSQVSSRVEHSFVALKCVKAIRALSGLGAAP